MAKDTNTLEFVGQSFLGDPIQFRFEALHNNITLNSGTPSNIRHFAWLFELVTYLEINRCVDPYHDPRSPYVDPPDEVYKQQIKERWQSIEWIWKDNEYRDRQVPYSTLYVAKPGAFGYKEHNLEISLVAVLELSNHIASRATMYMIVLSHMKSPLQETPKFTLLFVSSGLQYSPRDLYDLLFRQADVNFDSRSGNIGRMMDHIVTNRDSIDHN